MSYISDMSQSSSTFQAFFNAALQDYRDKTGNTLTDHPIAIGKKGITNFDQS
jgi:hypothetical protein